MGNHLFDALFAPHLANDRCFLARDGRPDVTYRDALRLAARMAHRLVEAGVTPGDRVLVQAPKSVEMVALYAATLQAGAVFLPLNTGYTQDELSYFASDATPRVLVCAPQDEARIEPLAQRIGARVLTLGADGEGSLTEGLDRLPDTFETVARGPDDLAGLLYTSGTTGRSKGAMMSHENLASNARALVDLWQITEQDRLIHALPIFHTHGLFVALNTSLLAGCAIEFMAGFDAGAILEALPRATMLMGVPTFYTRLLSEDRLGSERCANMRLFISGSAPLLAETHEAFTERTGHRILERYGMTETNMITSNPYSGDRRTGTVGLPLPGVEVRLTDETDGVGMIEVRGPNVFQGYWNLPEKTAEELHEDGFFVTGDLGTMSEDGYITIVGRAKDLIITGGYNVYPKEVEDVLNDVPGVVESAVFGVSDPDFGEAILAALVGDPEREEDLAQAAQAKLARFKHPRRYIFLEALPRNTMGKVKKNILRDMYG